MYEYFTRVQLACFVCIAYYFPRGYVFNHFPPPFTQKFNYPFAWFWQLNDTRLAFSTPNIWNNFLQLLLFWSLSVPTLLLTTVLCRFIPFLAQYYIHNFLPQLKFMSRYSVNELLSDSSIKMFRLSILLRLYVTSLINCTKLHFRLFNHTHIHPLLGYHKEHKYNCACTRNCVTWN